MKFRFAYFTFVSVARLFATRVGDIIEDDQRDFFVAPGSTLSDRYTFVKMLHRSGPFKIDEHDGTGEQSLLEVSATWPVRHFPSKFGRGTRVGAGAYGEVWLARDEEAEQDVAIKFFKHGGKHVMCGGLSSMRKSITDILAEAAEECKIAQKITESPEGELDPLGRARIARCLADEVGPNMNSSQSVPCYIVMENAGVSLRTWINEHKAKPKWFKGTTYYAVEARSMVKQLLQAIRFLNTFQPAYIHHDLKPENVVYKMVNGKPVVKVIDWGCVLEASNQLQDSKADLSYAPPEFSSSGAKLAYALPVHAFDMYQVGLIYLELICPTLIDVHKTFGQVVQNLWVGDLEKRQQIFKSASCCVDDDRPVTCVTNKDIRFIRNLVGPSGQRPHPSALLEDDYFQDRRFVLGELVEYFSEKSKTWKPAVVATVSDAGYKLNVVRKMVDEASIRKIENPELLLSKARSEIRCPTNMLADIFGNCICDVDKGYFMPADGSVCTRGGKLTGDAYAEPAKKLSFWEKLKRLKQQKQHGHK
eukprot:TRINITY_DN25648_c0_g1_i1.p1 TRINITY_DN25648_c0_g1~~TRINITY_DN25648_c0_g1_i1.p1  ORF type:complete len:532 (+),score=66.22 TRINITY_DN25648_c0_g1_i1:67-1662(+)